MLIPRYWAEARLQTKTPAKKQITVRRWGWSDESQDAARAHAENRTKDAMDRILRGENLRRRETKDPYGLNEGVPIREEVVSRHGEIAVTRNSYGALCLNTPNVFFADVDTRWRGASNLHPLGFILLVLAGLSIGIWKNSFLLGGTIAVVLPMIWFKIIQRNNRARRPAGEAAAKAEALAAIRAFATAHPAWHLRIYETPAGFRLLAMHDIFDPRGEPARSALEALDSDHRFARLCALQSCFRARVSPKYWRMGYQPGESLPKSKWPFPPEHLAPRKRWLDGYDKLAEGFAACRFVERVGSSTVHPEAEWVRDLHDRLSKVESSLPLA